MGSFWRARAYYAITYDISFPNQSRNHWEFTRYVRRSDLFESSAGGGAPGGGSGGVGNRSAKNPFRRGPDWNLTEQMRLQKSDPKLAERLRASA